MRTRELHIGPSLAALLALASGCAGGVGTDPSSNSNPSSVTTGATYELIRSGSAKCLDITAAGTTNGTAIEQYTCNQTGAQQFRVDDLGGGKVKLVNPVSGRCVDVAAAGTANGTSVQLYDCNGTGAQSFTVEDMGGGFSRLRNSNSNRCIDVSAASNADSAKVQIYDCNGTVAQSWQFVSVGGNAGGGGSGGGGGAAGGGGTAGGGGAGGGSTNCAPSWNVTDTCGGPVSNTVPNFGANVIIFDPSMSSSTIQSQLNSTNGKQEDSQFGTGRYAYFFKPGSYNNDVKLGFYQQAIGLGQSPDNVTITGAVRSKADFLDNANATCNFWRGAENMAVVPTSAIDGGKVIWAVSQGTHLRRMHIKGSINLDDGGWSSGGFIADTLIDGTINSGSQQQFITRNNDQNWTGGSWNMVFVGDGTAPGSSWPNNSYSVVAKTPVVREKPFLYLDSAGHYLVMVPSLKSNSSGHSWASGAAPGSPLAIDRFYIAKPTDNAAALNAQLAAGKHLLFTPGIYKLETSLQVNNPGTILLGLGLATLVPTTASAVITVADVDNVTVAGLLLEAGTGNSPTLLQIGPAGSSKDHSAAPTALMDLHCRVGGDQVGQTQSCFTINSNNVIIDNIWLWRADHGAYDGTAGWTQNPAANGIIVNGANVTAYGLFVEHFEQYETLWNGNGGSVYFYQSEMPYDPPNQASWIDPQGHWGYASYKVSNNVTSHKGLGIGVYSVFSNPVVAENAIETPANMTMNHLVTISLASGQIQHIINDTFGPVGNGTQKSTSSY